MAYKIIREDITKLHCDIIVNTANPKVSIGSGTDASIYEAAGKEQLFKEREKIGELKIGELGITPAFNLSANYIFHISGPGYIDGNHHEFEILKQCYELCLNKAIELNQHSIAFPLLGTGIYGIPKDEGLNIALNCFHSFLLKYELDIILVVFDPESYELSKKLFKDIETFIQDHYVEEILKVEYANPRQYETSNSIGSILHKSRRKAVNEEMFALKATFEEDTSISLEDFISKKDQSFSDKLFKLIDERGLKDSEVYKRANIDRKLFSKIRSNKDYKPGKKTAYALCISLKLNIEEANDLLKTINLTFSDSNKYDLIIKYFILQHNYDMFMINEALNQYGYEPFI